MYCKEKDRSKIILVKKKNPLTLPPDFSKLLCRKSEEREFEVENENELKNILKLRIIHQSFQMTVADRHWKIGIEGKIKMLTPT